MQLSIIIPAKNEAGSIGEVVGKIRSDFPKAELIVVDDGSTDKTAALAEARGAKVVSHPHSLGNGAAVKAGARAAEGEILVFLDADDQHDPADIPRLLEKLDEGYDMVVGARASSSHANTAASPPTGSTTSSPPWSPAKGFRT